MAVNRYIKLIYTSIFFVLLLLGNIKAFSQNNKYTLLGAGQVQTPVQVHLILDGKEVDFPEDILNDLAPVPFDELDDAIITMLIDTGLYQEVVVQKAVSNKKENVFIVQAKTIKRIQDIYLKGLSATERVEFERIISSQRGQPFREANANADSKRIEKALISKGYPNAVVDNATVNELSADSVQLEFNIDKGNPCRIDQVVIEDSFSNILNFLTIPIETGSVCDLSVINESLEQLKENYWEQGYLEAKVKVKEISYSSNKESAKIVLQIDRGKRTTFQIFDQDSGLLNTDFLVSKQGLTYSDIILLTDSDLLIILTDFYKKQGYAFVNVIGPERIVDKDGNTVLKFLLKKGDFIKIGKVTFIGSLPDSENNIVEEMGLKKGIFSGSIPFFQENLNIYRDNLRNLLLKRGYTDAQVSNPDFIPNEKNTEMNLVFRVEKGNKYIVNDINFIGIPTDFQLNNDKIAQILSKGVPYSFQVNQAFQEELKKQFLSQGYLYAHIGIEHVVMPEKKGERLVNLAVKIESGQIIRIRKLYIDSDIFGKEKSILMASGLDSGDIFDQESFDLARQRIMRHELFSTVSIEPLDLNAIDRKETRLDIIIHARSKSGYTLGLSPGYGQLRGYNFGVDFTLNRLNNDGLRFFSTASVSQEKQQESFASTDTRQILGRQISLGLTEPLFKLGPLLTPFDVTGVTGYQVAAETLTNREYFTFKFIVNWKPSFFNLNWDISESFLHEASKSTSSESAIVQTLDSPSIVTRELTSSISLDTRNNQAWPTKGGHQNFQVSFARFGIGSDVQYNRYSGSSDFFFPIYKKLSGAITLGAYVITDTVNRDGSTITPPASKRATLTDTALVRGFPETYGSTAPGPLLWIHYQNNGVPNCNTQLASIGATNLIYVKAESRYRISESFGAVLFVDSAANYFTQQEVNQIANQINKQIVNQSSLSSNGTVCVPDNAALISPASIRLQDSNFLEQYWEQAYVSTGIGLRLILGNYATLSLDYGYPLKDPSSNQSNCVSPSEALNSSTAPTCVTRIQDSSYFGGNIMFRGALHLKIGAQF